MGRKSTYDPAKHPERALVLATAGRTDEEIAASLGIGLSAFYEWQRRFVEFAQAIKTGKEKPNRDVEAALYKRAIGYDVTEAVVVTDPKTKKQRTVRATRRHVPGDTTAMIFFLKNRVPARWKDVRHQHHGGEVNLRGTDLSALSDTELAELERLLLKADAGSTDETPAS